MRSICVFNYDSNSNVVLNVFSKIARSGKRVLYVDFRQNKTRKNANKKLNDNLGLNSSNMLLENRSPEKYITSLELNLDIIKGGGSLYAEEFETYNNLFKYDWIEKKFKNLSYDYIVFDVSPVLSILNMNILFFSKEVMSVINLSESGIDFVYKLAYFLTNFNGIYSKKLFLSKIVPVYSGEFDKSGYVHLVSSFSSRVVPFPISIKGGFGSDFITAISEISKSILEDDKIFDKDAKPNERQKLINEYLEILLDNTSKDSSLNKFVRN